MHVDLIHWLRFCLFSLQVIWETLISGMMTFTQVIYFRTLKPYTSGCLVKKRYTLVNIWTTFRNQVVRHHRRRQSNLTNHSGNHESLVQWLIWAVCLYRLRAQVDFWADRLQSLAHFVLHCDVTANVLGAHRFAVLISYQ